MANLITYALLLSLSIYSIESKKQSEHSSSTSFSGSSSSPKDLTTIYEQAKQQRLKAGPYECNFLTDSSTTCMLPWPDNFFYAPTWNPNAPLGLTLTNNSLPIDDSGNSIDPDIGGYNAMQGFSPMGPILAYLPGINMDLSGLPRLWNISNSVSVGVNAIANSVLLGVNYKTGVVTPYEHWIELDHSGDSPTPYERTLIAWPASRLNDSSTYIVAFRRIVDDNGIPLSASDGFMALRDNIPTSNPALEASRTRFNNIFTALESIGWNRTTLTLAWDFTTNTQIDITGKFLHMRDDAFARIAALGPSGVPYNITKIEDNPATNVTRRILGQFYVPCYLPDRAVPSLNSKLVLDPTTKLPVFQEFVPFDFEVVIPTSITLPGAAPAKVVQYGHGLFGDCGEVEEGYLAFEGNENGYIYGATDWIGLSEYDEATVVVMLAESFNDFAIVPDRLHQGMLNALVLMKMMTQSSFVNDPAVTYNGKSIISTNSADWHYTGNSQGGIMGAVYAAVSTDVERSVLGVGGGPYAILLPRSTDFQDLSDLLKLKYPRSIDRMESLALIQILWDRMDGSGYASYISNPLPNTPSHRSIWHYGLGDAQVSWLGAHAIALSAGASMYASNVREGNETLTQFNLIADSTVLTTGNLIMGFDYGLPQVPFVNIPPNDGYDAHECPRRTPEAQQQMAHFFITGEIINTCNGACTVPAPDNCDH